MPNGWTRPEVLWLPWPRLRYSNYSALPIRSWEMTLAPPKCHRYSPVCSAANWPGDSMTAGEHGCAEFSYFVPLGRQIPEL